MHLACWHVFHDPKYSVKFSICLNNFISWLWFYCIDGKIVMAWNYDKINTIKKELDTGILRLIINLEVVSLLHVIFRDEVSIWMRNPPIRTICGVAALKIRIISRLERHPNVQVLVLSSCWHRRLLDIFLSGLFNNILS